MEEKEVEKYFNSSRQTDCNFVFLDIDVLTGGH